MGGQGSGRYPRGAKVLDDDGEDQWEDIQRKIALGQDIEPAEVLSNKYLSREVIMHTVDRLMESEDTELAQVVRGLTWKALLQANNILDNGEHRDRMVIIRLLLTNAARLIGATSSTTVEEGRVALSQVLEGMKELPTKPNAAITTTSPTTDDSD